MEDYNSEPGTPRTRQYLLDGDNFRVGPLTMRQVRVKPGLCCLRRESKQTTNVGYLHVMSFCL